MNNMNQQDQDPKPEKSDRIEGDALKATLDGITSLCVLAGTAGVIKALCDDNGLKQGAPGTDLQNSGLNEQAPKTAMGFLQQGPGGVA